MSDWLEITRRRCLALLAGTFAALSLPRPSAAKRSIRRIAPAARWRAQLRSPESAAIVGLAYLDVEPRSLAQVLADLDAAVAAPAALHELSDADLGRRLRARIRADYAAERTLRLDSWVVSRSEAQLCAVFALTRN